MIQQRLSVAFVGPYVAVIVIALFIANAAKAQTGSRCSELAVTLDQLRLEIASVEAELRSLCNPQSNEARRLGAPEPNRTALVIQPSQSIEATGDNTSDAVQQPGRADGAHAESGRRRRAGQGDIHATYAVECWAAGSAFLHDARCNCLGEPAHPKLGSRRTIKILLASWYGRCASCRVMLQAGFARATVGLSSGMHTLWHASVACRPGAALDTFLLKIVVEERLGYPVQLLSDGQLADIGPGLKISEGTSVVFAIYSALARGEVDVHPEVTPGYHAL